MSFSKIHLAIYEFPAPSSYSPLDDQTAFNCLHDLAAKYQWTFSQQSVQNREEKEQVVGSICSQINQHNPELIMILISGHGEQITIGKEPQNTIILKNPRNRLSLDDLSKTLDDRLSIPFLLVIDACEVYFPGWRKGNGVGSVLFAGPKQKAMSSTNGGGFLTQGLISALSTEPPQPNWLQLVNHAINYVVRESHDQQKPELVKLGELDLEKIPFNIPKSLPIQAGLDSVLIEMCHKDELPLTALEQIYNKLNKLPDREESELFCLVCAYLLDKRSNIPNLESILLQILRNNPNPQTISFETTQSYAWLSLGARSKEDIETRISWVNRRIKLLKDRDLTELQKQIYARLLDTCGTLIRLNNHLTKAKKQYDQSMDLKKELNPPDLIGMEMTRQNKGWLCLGLGRFDESEIIFLNGIQRCEEILEQNCHFDSIALYREISNSWSFHIFGLLVTYLLSHKSIYDFEVIEAKVKTKIGLYKNLKFITPTQLGDVELLLCYIHNKKRMKDGSFHTHFPINQSLAAIFELVAVGRTDGVLKVEEMVQLWINDPKNRLNEDLSIHMIQLAMLCALCQEFPNKERFKQIRRRFINYLKEDLDERYAPFPSASERPWSNRGSLCKIQSKAWSQWGPLKAQFSESTRPGVWIDHTVTEKYLQVLVWQYAIFGLFVGKVTTSKAFAWLNELFPEHPGYRLGLGTAFPFASKVYKSIDPQSSWGKELKNTWDNLLNDLPYNSVSDIANERNQGTHHENLSTNQVQQRIKRHEVIIERLVNMIDPKKYDLPVPRISSQFNNGVSEYRLSDDQLRPISLEDHITNPFDCGPLLVGHRNQDDKSPQVFYIPHTISNEIIKSGEGKITYRRYGESFSGNSPAEIKCTVYLHDDNQVSQCLTQKTSSNMNNNSIETNQITMESSEKTIESNFQIIYGQLPPKASRPTKVYFTKGDKKMEIKLTRWSEVLLEFSKTFVLDQDVNIIGWKRTKRSKRILFSDINETSDHRYKEIAPGIFMCTNFSSRDIIRNINALIDYLSLPKNCYIIYYKNSNDS